MIKRYVATVQWPKGGVEEIDVEAEDLPSARLQVILRLVVDYQPGGVPIKIDRAVLGRTVLVSKDTGSCDVCGGECGEGHALSF